MSSRPQQRRPATLAAALVTLGVLTFSGSSLGALAPDPAPVPDAPTPRPDAAPAASRPITPPPSSSQPVQRLAPASRRIATPRRAKPAARETPLPDIKLPAAVRCVLANVDDARACRGVGVLPLKRVAGTPRPRASQAQPAPPVAGGSAPSSSPVPITLLAVLGMSLLAGAALIPLAWVVRELLGREPDPPPDDYADPEPPPDDLPRTAGAWLGRGLPSAQGSLGQDVP